MNPVRLPAISPRHARGRRWGTLLLGLLAAGCVPPLVADCESDHRVAQAAADQADLDRVLDLARQMDRSGCPRPYVKDVKLMGADLAAARAETLIAQGRLDDAEKLLARVPVSTWLTEVWNGDIAAGRKDWVRAAKRYNRAYTLMLDPEATPQRPPQAFIDRVFERASQASVLSDDLSVVASRSGKPSGIYAPSSKGHVAVPAPVRFKTRKATLDAKGEEQAGWIADYVLLKQQNGAESVTIVGHADERGDPNFNLVLSERRAETLARFLRDRGVTLPIRTRGEGETRPFEYVRAPGSPELTNEERWRLDRRVEYEFD